MGRCLALQLPPERGPGRAKVAQAALPRALAVIDSTRRSSMAPTQCYCASRLLGRCTRFLALVHPCQAARCLLAAAGTLLVLGLRPLVAAQPHFWHASGPRVQGSASQSSWRLGKRCLLDLDTGVPETPLLAPSHATLATLLAWTGEA